MPRTYEEYTSDFESREHRHHNARTVPGAGERAWEGGAQHNDSRAHRVRVLERIVVSCALIKLPVISATPYLLHRTNFQGRLIIVEGNLVDYEMEWLPLKLARDGCLMHRYSLSSSATSDGRPDPPPLKVSDINTLLAVQKRAQTHFKKAVPRELSTLSSSSGDGKKGRSTSCRSRRTWRTRSQRRRARVSPLTFFRHWTRFSWGFIK
mgnify:CR=1 FL=1